MKRMLNGAHSLYKAAFSPWLHTFGLTGSCRFQPTCSEYATLGFAQHGLIRGAWLAFSRVLRCHPFSRGGWDPVPPPATDARQNRPSGRPISPEK